MTKVPTIHLTHKSSGWVLVRSGNALPATYAYIQRFGRFMSLVCFGDSGLANVGEYAVQHDRLIALKAHIEKHGLVWQEIPR